MNAGSSALDCSVAAIARDHRLGIGRLAARAGDQRAHHQFLHRLVAGERIGVGLRQPLELVRRGARRSTMTGAEKSRLIDSSGGSVDVVEA